MSRRGVPPAVMPADELAVALQQSEARYRSLVQRAGFGIYVATLDGRFLDVNPALARMLGYDTVDELLTLDLSRDVYLDPEERARLIARSAEVGGNWVEARWKRRDGTPIMVRIALQRVLDEQDQLVAFEGIAEDITERRRQEELLRRSERMASLGTTLAGVAHELNNPLAAIMGFAQLLLKRDLLADDRMAVETINHEAERSAKIVRDLLSLARKREANRRSAVNINDIVGYILRTRRYALDTSEIVTEIDLDPALPPVYGDRTQLEQVLLNLVTNAEQALRCAIDDAKRERRPMHARLTIRTRRDGDDAVLEVADNGQGIPAESQSQIWDPFWSTRAEGEGTGLGLSVVHHIITEHGGSIEMLSQESTGACFRARLPLPRDSNLEVTTHASGIQAARALDILVIATNQAEQHFLTRFLTSRGHAVLATGDVDRARRFAEQMTFDAVVIDIDSDELEHRLIADLRHASGAVRARTIVVARAKHDHRSDASDLPSTAVAISKPYDVEHLREAVENR